MKTLKQLFFILSLGFFSSLAAFAEPLQNTLERAQQGDAEAQFKLGAMYLLGQGVKQDYFVAIKWFEKAAEQGNANAQYGLGGGVSSWIWRKTRLFCSEKMV